MPAEPMEVLLIGAGSVTSKLNITLVQHGFSISAQLPNLTPNMLNGFDAKTIVVVAPECSIAIDTLVYAAERGRYIVVVGGGSDPVTAWANSVNVPLFAYPPTDVDVSNMISELRRVESGTIATDEQYRRAVLGSDMVARLQSGMAIRKIAVTSPKGGTGKTTIAVNLAVAMALCGVSTYLVDADANAGAMLFHLRLNGYNTESLIRLLKREVASAGNQTLAGIASSAAYLSSFTQIDELPSLRVLPGLTTDNLADPVFSEEKGIQRINEVVKGLYNIGPASNGVTIMDVGINPAHPLHSAALREAESMVIVIKPEVPDLAETLRWIKNVISGLSDLYGSAAAREFVGTRIRICYNQVVGDSFKGSHKMLQDALKADGIDFEIVPNGIIPMVDPLIAMNAVNSERREDILIWRAKREHPEELTAFAESLISFAAHFVPSITEAAARVGIIRLKDSGRKRRSWFGFGG